MMVTDSYRAQDEQELIVENHNISTDLTHYLRVDWYAEDPHPEENKFETLDFGPCPKQMAVLNGVHCVRTDCSFISKN